MTLKLYNSLSKSVEEFKPLHPGFVTMYNCGPTVYSTAHIGNFRSFIVVDLLRRVLEHAGLKVHQVMNITDVGHLTDDGDDGDDKLAVAAKKEKLHPLDIAKKYTAEFLADWKTLNMLEPEARPKATETVNEMISMIQSLLDNGHAYAAGNNIYFDIASFPDYGKLSGNTLDKLGNNRVEKDLNKKNPQDFVLWFGESKFENHILKWNSPWGEGYPGWHMECSAMAAKYLTPAFEGGSFDATKCETIDIHTGGEDNRFPHHECEIAQSQGATQRKYVSYWLHVRHLMIEGEKMSKSLGNIYYIQQLVDEGISWRAIRYVLLSTHYRSPLNFTKDGLVAAQKNLDRIDEVLKRLAAVRIAVPFDESTALALNETKLLVEQSLFDDLNMSGALGALADGIKLLNSALDENKLGQAQATKCKEELFSLDTLFGFFDSSIFEESSLAPELVELLVARETARENKNWSESDRLRDELKSKGVEVSDGKDGQSWKLL